MISTGPDRTREATAISVPIVAADIPGFRTVMRDGRQGRFVRAGDATALADGVLTLLSNDKLRRAMSTEGRRRASEYDWSEVAVRLEKLYHSLL